MEKLNERAEGNAKMLKSALGSAGSSVVNRTAVVVRKDQNTGDTLWLAMHANNNNNALDELEDTDDVFASVAAEKQLKQESPQQQQLQMQQKNTTEQLNSQKRWKRRVAKPLRAFCEAVGVSSTQKQSAITMEEAYVGVVEKNSDVVSNSSIVEVEAGSVANAVEQEQLQQNGASTPNNSCGAQTNTQLATIAIPAATATVHVVLPMAVGAAAVEGDTLDIDYDAYAAVLGADAGAASLTPPDNSHSNRTSLNNSTENLSYSSDNYYGDDLLMFDGIDDDVDGEEISLNSDDCVYAYRGDGANFELALDAFAARGSGVDAAGMADDETDFLEMDFEPDPLSEIEYGFIGMSVAPVQSAHQEAFLLQRDSCHLSGHHSANTGGQQTPVTSQRQLFSSPIDDLPAVAAATTTAPKVGLQSQALLNKNFARITLHLDQIKGELADYDCLGAHTRNDRLSVLGVDDLSDGVDVAKMAATASTPSAHSLPNTLHAHFGLDVPESKDTRAHTAKLTGAKPKRLSTFSTSSSTSSKNSSKSRTSLRSAYALPLCNSSSFDERSVSCTEFRSACVAATAAPPPPTANDDCLPCAAPPANCADFNINDETCLDCLEKEFLANTIGRALEPHVCPKCRRRSGGLGSSRTFYARTEQSHCRSGSPAFFLEVREHDMFETANEFMQAHSKRKEPWKAASFNSKMMPAATVTVTTAGDKIKNVAANVLDLQESGGALTAANQRRTTCDNFKGEQLLQNILLTEPEIATISTINLTEETLVQALEKLHIIYNAELLKSHFRCNSSTSNLHKTATKMFKSLKHMLLHEAKKQGNYVKLIRLIELATRQQATVQFKKDTNISHTEMVQVKVADILQQWTHTNNLELLQQLDKRFVEANILGKIANIIRQAQHRCSTRRPLPEFISIPQYYASGYLILTKKC